MQGTHAQETRIGIGRASRVSGLSVDTLRRAADAGKLPHSRTPGGQRRFRESDVIALAADEATIIAPKAGDVSPTLPATPALEADERASL